MKLQSFFDAAAGVGLTRKAVQRSYPAENILLATFVTFLKNRSDVPPVGASLRRIFQRRGAIVVTTQRIVFQTNSKSILTLALVVVFNLSLFSFVMHPSFAVGCVCVVFLGALIQNRPYTMLIPFRDIRDVELHTASSLMGAVALLRVTTEYEVLDFVARGILISEVYCQIAMECRAAKALNNRTETQPDEIPR